MENPVLQAINTRKDKKNIKTPLKFYVAIFGVLTVILSIIGMIAFNNNQWLCVLTLVLGVVLSLAYFTTDAKGNSVSIICPNPNCGFRGEVEPQGGTDGCLFAVLLFFGIIPGILYILICGGMHKIICPKCGMRIR
jgi:hypothetical protein